ncbi:MAG: FMN-binding protein [Pseudomonadales bacterium]
MTERELLGLWATPVAAIVLPLNVAFAADYLDVAQAQRLLFPDATTFVDRTVTLTDAQRSEIRKRAGVRQRSATQRVWRSERNGQPLGWFIVDDVIGKHEFITYAVAISPQGEVLGVEILSYRETHGGEVRDASWREHFDGKTLADPLRLDRDIPNISGATLSCRNLVDGVKRLLVLHDLVLRHV